MELNFKTAPRPCRQGNWMKENEAQFLLFVSLKSE